MIRISGACRRPAKRVPWTRSEQWLASYLAAIHRVKRKDPDLYRRRLRELIGHGECIMGLTDSYPKRYAFITEGLLRSIEEKL